MYLAGDIGGTHARLALFSTELKIVRIEIFQSRRYSSLDEVVDLFLSHHDSPIVGACIGVAGPVRNGVCVATNLPWIVDSNKLKQKLGVSVFLINDLEANASGVEILLPEDFLEINKGNVQEAGNKALVSAGTGLGEALLFWNGKTYVPSASEGGHTDFAPRNEDEVMLFYYLKEKFGHVSYERVVSGQGLWNLYRFLVDVKKMTPLLELNESSSFGAQLSECAEKKRCPVCLKVLSMFVELYGAEAGNAALKFNAYSGVYLGGGIASKLVGLFKEGEFMRAFIDKGRFSSLLENIPVKIILNDNAALLGAAHHVASSLKKN